MSGQKAPRTAVAESQTTHDPGNEPGETSGIRTRNWGPDARPVGFFPPASGSTADEHHLAPVSRQPMSGQRRIDLAAAERDVARIVDECIIGPGCLDVALPLTTSACSSVSMAKIRAFIDASPTLRGYSLLTRRRVCERAVLVAAEMLGDDRNLSEVQLARKAEFHLLMSVEMLIEWLLDDTLDLNSSVDSSFRSALAELYCAMLLEEPPSVAEQAALIRANSARNHVPERFIDALVPLLQWRRALALAAGVPHQTSSFSIELLRRFLGSYLNTRDAFESWEAYELHRADNGALPLEILLTTYWNCYRLGFDPSEIEQDQPRFLAILSRYGVIGALSNDLFGYEKDIEEGVATSVEVVKHTLLRGAGEEEALTHAAFAHVIEIHNERLEELATRTLTSPDRLEASTLLSCLRSVWAIRILHQEHGSIYHPGWLKKTLLSHPANAPISTRGAPKPSL